MYKLLSITFRMRRSRGEMYIGHERLCPSVPRHIPTLAYCTDPDATWRNGRGVPLLVHYWVDLQSVHGFRCYDNTAPNAKCQRVLVMPGVIVLAATRSEHFFRPPKGTPLRDSTSFKPSHVPQKAHPCVILRHLSHRTTPKRHTLA